MPDRHKGDLGLEAFTHEGAAFQCYAAEEPLDVKSLYEHQRDKLTSDLNKLRNNHEDLAKLLGEAKIQTYVFMVHRRDSRQLVSHAQGKVAEVKSWGLPFIADNFAITIEDDNNYDAERDALWSIPSPLIDTNAADASELERWRDVNAPMLSEANRKLAALGLEGAVLSAYIDTLLAEYLRGENMMTSLRSSFPDSWQAVARAQSTKEDLLAIEYPVGSARCTDDVKTIALELQTDICEAAPTVTPINARSLAWASVADWIFRCPLDFEPVS